MPNSLHLKLASVAKKLIATHGRTMQLLDPTKKGKSYSPDIIIERHNVTAVQVSLKFGSGVFPSGDKATSMSDDKVIIRSDDKVIIMAAGGIRPTSMMKLLDERELEIINVSEVKPADVAIIYRILCR